MANDVPNPLAARRSERDAQTPVAVARAARAARTAERRKRLPNAKTPTPAPADQESTPVEPTAIEQMKTEARAAGVLMGGERYLRHSIRTQIRTRTGISNDAANTVVDGLNVVSLLDANGNIDSARVDALADLMHPDQPQPGAASGGDIVFAALNRSAAIPPGFAGSVNALREQMKADHPTGKPMRR